jgi:hypothetical protein
MVLMAEFTQPLQRRTFRFHVEPADGTPRMFSSFAMVRHEAPSV